MKHKAMSEERTQIRVPVEPEPHPSTESLEYRASSGIAYGCGPGPYLNILDAEGYRCPLGKPGDEVWFADRFSKIISSIRVEQLGDPKRWFWVVDLEAKTQ